MRLPHAIPILLLSLVAVLGAAAQEPPEILPKVVRHAEPVYPPIARAAHIVGDVRVKITTDGESVRDAQAETGPPMLRKTAEDNARTWKFVAHTPGTFHVNFRYKLSSDDVEVAFLESPSIVEIRAPAPAMIIDNGWIGLGRWKAQLKGVHGNSSEVFTLSYSGPDGEWLNGNALNSKGENDEIDFGHKEGDLLGFTISLSHPDGQHIKTFFVGKMMRDKIVGTFVDDAGSTGQWTAVRVPEKPVSP
jgi:hypothetical protein